MKRDGGFTLIEVIVALAVLAAVAGAIASLSSSSRRTAGVTAEREALVFVARSVLDEQFGSRDPAATGARAGSAGAFVWRIDARPIAPEAVRIGRALWRPMRVEVDVEGPTGARLRIETVRLERAPP